MSQQERYAWVMLVVAPVGYAVYLAWVLGEAGGTPLSAVAYQGPMLWCIGGGIVGAIVLSIVAGIVAGMLGDGSLVVDARDREISRLGEYIGQSFVVIGGVAGLILAMLGVDQFWIANAIYLCFVLSALVGSIAKIAFYRLGLSA
jgi:hypothetical protein